MTHWVTSWASAANGVAAPRPLQPELIDALGDVPCRAHDQSFRMIIRPSLLGDGWRLRLGNVYGDRPLRIERASAGIRCGGAALRNALAVPVTFGGARETLIAVGDSAISDPFRLPEPVSDGVDLALSFHVRESGLLTWHEDAFATSYIAPPGSGDRTARPDEAAFPYATTSWLLLQAVDVAAAPEARAIVALGDSITDGWITTMNGHDRWTDVLARRLAALRPHRYAVVNQGLCGNHVSRGDLYNPSALARFDRDVGALSGVGGVILFDGTNDLGSGVLPEEISRAMRAIAAKAHAAGLRIFGATILPRGPDHALAECGGGARYLKSWERVNDFIRASGSFDAVLDFAAQLCRRDDRTHLDAAYIPNTLGPGDGLHPNRLANLRLAESVPLSLFDALCEGLSPPV